MLPDARNMEVEPLVLRVRTEYRTSRVLLICTIDRNNRDRSIRECACDFTNWSLETLALGVPACMLDLASMNTFMHPKDRPKHFAAGDT